MPNFLDLRKKIQPQILVVEKVVFKRRSIALEFFRILAIIGVVSVSVWGISNASDSTTLTDQSNGQTNIVENFGAIGTVSNINEKSISVDNARDVNGGAGISSYSFDVGSLETIQTDHYQNLQLSDIEIGDNVIVQGTKTGDQIVIEKIYSYGTSTATGMLTPLDSSQTVDSTEKKDIASPTVDVSDSVATTSTDTISTSTDNFITASSSGSSTNENATSRQQSPVSDISATSFASSSRSVATTSSVDIPAPTSTVLNIITNVGQKTSDVLSGNLGTDTPAQDSSQK